MLFSSTKQNSFSFKNAYFESFLSTVIDFQSTQEFVEEVFFNKSLQFQKNQDIHLSGCTFTKCVNEKKASAISGEESVTKNMRLTCERCCFITCLSGGNAGAIYFHGSYISFVGSCFEFCWCQSRYQSFFMCSSGEGELVMCMKDQCAPRYPVGFAFTEHLRAHNASIVDCNHTRSSVKERRSCASLGKNAFLRYQWIMNINNTGQTMFGFQLDSNQWYEISDVIMYKCHPTSQGTGMIETGKHIVIKRFTFIRTKLLFSVLSDSEGNRHHGVEALFVDCITDTPRDKLVFEDKNITEENLTIVTKGYIPSFDIVYEEWMCKTDIPRTQLPTVSPTVKPTMTQSPYPSITIPPIHIKENDKEPELIDFEKSDDKFKFTKGDLMMFLILFILVITTFIIYVMTFKKRKAGVFTTKEEQEHLIQY